MTLEPTSQDEWDPWDVNVWLDAGLDYEDPNLDEQDVLDQIVAEGSIEFAYLADIAWDAGRFMEDGTVYDVGALITISAGIVSGPIGIDTPVVGIKTRVNTSENFGTAEHTMYQYALIESVSSIEEAIYVAGTIAEAALDYPGDPEGVGSDPPGRTPPGNDTPHPVTPPGNQVWCITNDPPNGDGMGEGEGGEQVDPCCQCEIDYNNCVDACSLSKKHILDLCISGGILGSLAGVAAIVKCTGFCITNTSMLIPPWVTIACLLGCAAIGAAIAYAIYKCSSAYNNAVAACINGNPAENLPGCETPLADCLAAHDCD